MQHSYRDSRIASRMFVVLADANVGDRFPDVENLPPRNCSETVGKKEGGFFPYKKLCVKGVCFIQVQFSVFFFATTSLGRKFLYTYDTNLLPQFLHDASLPVLLNPQLTHSK